MQNSQMNKSHTNSSEAKSSARTNYTLLGAVERRTHLHFIFRMINIMIRASRINTRTAQTSRLAFPKWALDWMFERWGSKYWILSIPVVFFRSLHAWNSSKKGGENNRDKANRFSIRQQTNRNAIVNGLSERSITRWYGWIPEIVNKLFHWKSATHRILIFQTAHAQCQIYSWREAQKGIGRTRGGRGQPKIWLAASIVQRIRA